MNLYNSMIILEINNCLKEITRKISQNKFFLTRAHKTAILTTLAIFLSYKTFKITKQLYHSWFTQRLKSFYENELNPECESEINEVKKKLIFEKLKEHKLRSHFSCYYILEIGYCGSNFSFFPDRSIVTICNFYKRLEPFIFKQKYKYGSDLWIKNDNILRSFAQIKSNSIDAVVCTYYLSSTKNPHEIVQEVRRVLRPGGLFIYIEHIKENKSLIRTILQYFSNPIWKLLNNGDSLTKLSINTMESSKFRIIDQRISLINLYKTNRILNYLTNMHVCGIAEK